MACAQVTVLPAAPWPQCVCPVSMWLHPSGSGAHAAALKAPSELLWGRSCSNGGQAEAPPGRRPPSPLVGFPDCCPCLRPAQLRSASPTRVHTRAHSRSHTCAHIHGSMHSKHTRVHARAHTDPFWLAVALSVPSGCALVVFSVSLCPLPRLAHGAEPSRPPAPYPRFCGSLCRPLAPPPPDPRVGGASVARYPGAEPEWGLGSGWGRCGELGVHGPDFLFCSSLMCQPRWDGTVKGQAPRVAESRTGTGTWRPASVCPGSSLPSVGSGSVGA